MEKSIFKIALLEDDKSLAIVIKRKFESGPFKFVTYTEGESLLATADLQAFDLILADISLPGMSGLEVVGQIRERGVSLPIIVITGNVDRNHELSSYQSGATVFHPKPIDFDLLLAQMRSLLDVNNQDSSLVVGDAELNLNEYKLYFNGNQLVLSQKEFALIRLLMANPTKVFNRDQILKHTFSGVYEPQPSSVDTLVSRLRKKIDAEDSESFIQTVHGLGFRLASRIGGSGDHNSD